MVLMLGSAVSTAQTLQWAGLIEGTGDNKGAGVRWDDQGNLILLAHYHDAIDLDPSAGILSLPGNSGLLEHDDLLAKYTPIGSLIWHRRVDADGGLGWPHMFLDSAYNIYLAGSLDGSVTFVGCTLVNGGPGSARLSKYAPTGACMWTNLYPSLTVGSGISDGIVSTANGSIAVVGAFSGFIDTDPGSGSQMLYSFQGNDGFIAFLDSSGGYVNAGQISGPYGQNVRCLGTDATGSTYLTGTHQGITDVDPGSGADSLSCVGVQCMYLAKLNPSGQYQWSRSIGDMTSCVISDMVVTPLGVNFITGWFNGSPDFDPGPGVQMRTCASGNGCFFVASYSTNGDFRWAHALDASSRSGGLALVDSGSVAQESGSLFLAGSFRGTIDLDPSAMNHSMTSATSTDWDGFVATYDYDGNFRCAFPIQGQESQFIEGIDAVAPDHVAVTGFTYGATDFDPGPAIYTLTATANHDIFLAHYTMPCTAQVGMGDRPPECTVRPYPNPSNGSFTVTMDCAPSTSQTVSVMGLDGKFIKAVYPSGRGAIDIRPIARGTYLCASAEETSARPTRWLVTVQ